MNSKSIKSRVTENDRFITKLNEQLCFLERSCSLFDQGHEEEAIRLAIAMRIIFHQTKNSTSLLRHLRFFNTKILSSNRGLGDFKNYISFSIKLNTNTPVKAVPMLGDFSSFKKCIFDYWWAEESIFIHEGKVFTRKDLILSVANKDGGAHVDSKLEDYYMNLGSGVFALGIKGKLKYPGGPPFEQGIPVYANNIHLALIRQFAHETLVSAKHFNWMK